MNKPFFSIVVVSLNAETTIAKTINSVLKQTCEDYEIIVKDGLSKDNTIKNIPQSEKIKVYEKADKSIYDAMNQGIEYANGKFICFLNCGDYFADDTDKYVLIGGAAVVVCGLALCCVVLFNSINLGGGSDNMAEEHYTFDELYASEEQRTIQPQETLTYNIDKAIKDKTQELPVIATEAKKTKAKTKIWVIEDKRVHLPVGISTETWRGGIRKLAVTWLEHGKKKKKFFSWS